jgi:hypothetical protein
VIVRMYKPPMLSPPNILTLYLLHQPARQMMDVCLEGTLPRFHPRNQVGEERPPTYSSSSSEIDSKDEVLPWLLFLLLDPPPDDPVCDGLVF